MASIPTFIANMKQAITQDATARDLANRSAGSAAGPAGAGAKARDMPSQ
ncbi:hypothetical protein GCM10010176_078580 [Nonomuraea spiralis]|nr:hypothetical protein GCM10010176_078580 [Nonomuraea spiralis]